MISKLIFSIFSILALVLVFTLVPPPGVASANGDHPYICGYLDTSAKSARAVIMRTSFMDVVSAIPDNERFSSLTSVAGYYGVSPTEVTGWIYQNPMQLKDDNSTVWVPQAWYGRELMYLRVFDSFGTGNWWGYYLRTQLLGGPGCVDFMVWGYPNFYSEPPVYRYYCIRTGLDIGLSIGTVYRSGQYVRPFQFGLEPTCNIQEEWDLIQIDIGYYKDGAWRYNQGRVGHRDNSPITWCEEYGFVAIGDYEYEGVNKLFSDEDEVIWEWTGQTIGHNALLWSQSGTISPWHEAPFGGIG